MNHLESNKPLDWQELIQQARAGDDAALGQIVSRVRNYLLFIANDAINPKLQSKLGASDIVQQSMLEAHQSIDRFNGTSEAEIRAWLRKIVLSNLIDSTRRYKDSACRSTDREVSIDKLSGPLPQPKTQTASWYVSRSEVEEQLLRAINRLPERQRQVIEARHRLGHSYREIASDMEVSEVAVRKLWSRGVVHLKKVLGEK